MCVRTFCSTDYVPILNVMMFVNGTGAMTFILARFPNKWTSILSVCFFSVYIAIFQSQVFIFTKTLFRSVHFGKLAGIALMLGGMLSLVFEETYKRITATCLDGDSVPLLWAHVGVLISSYVLLIPMARAAKRKRADINAHQVLLSHAATARDNRLTGHRAITIAASSAGSC